MVNSRMSTQAKKKKKNDEMRLQKNDCRKSLPHYLKKQLYLTAPAWHLIVQTIKKHRFALIITEYTVTGRHVMNGESIQWLMTSKFNNSYPFRESEPQSVSLSYLHMEDSSNFLQSKSFCVHWQTQFILWFYWIYKVAIGIIRETAWRKLLHTAYKLSLHR